MENDDDDVTSLPSFCEETSSQAGSGGEDAASSQASAAAVAEAADADAAAIAECRAAVADSLAALRSRRESLDRIRAAAEAQQREVRDQVERSFQMIERVLRTRKAHLGETLEDLQTQRSDMALKEAAQITGFEEEMTAALKRLDGMNGRLDPQTGRAELRGYAKLARNRPKTHPSEDDALSYYPTDLDQVFSHIHRAGLIALGSVQASNSTLEHEQELRSCSIREEHQVTVVPRDSRNRKVDPSVLGHINCVASLSSPFEKSHFVAVMQDSNTVKVRFQLEEEGTFELSVKMLGEHIRGSPFTIRAVNRQDSGGGGSGHYSNTAGASARRRSSLRPGGGGSNAASATGRLLTPSISVSGGAGTGGSGASGSSASAGSKLGAASRRPSSRLSRQSLQVEDDLVQKVGGRGRGHGEFNNPQGVCVTREGRIVVADSNNANVQVFGPGGEFLARFGLRGRDPGQVQRPIGIAETATGSYLVSDYDSRCIHVFSPDGKYLSKFGGNRLSGPKGIAVLSDGRIAVVDNKACCVLLFKHTGKLVQKFGSRGTGDSQFAGPHYVAVNSKDQMVVSDFHNHCVKVFDSQGGFQFCIGCAGSEAGRFNAPTGVAVDLRDNILVADWGSSSLQVFSSEGSFLATVNSAGDQLYGPQGLAYSAKLNQLVVVDTGNHCFKVYKSPISQ